MRDEVDREESPARGRHLPQQQSKDLALLVEAIAEAVIQNNHQLRQTLQAVERLARVVEEVRQDGERPH
ncbi:MAG: hypothetical protein HC899_25965 [Leptolyngbyaceae cyanobacterium SM1_4_3]|nr:hypothetical protein [Leptolyngbyaceae cyanobacterium SM1_4_3]NJO66962.1 hypothetical protein [Leptolyngbyaceae cyanobacterium RM1_405_57]